MVEERFRLYVIVPAEQAMISRLARINSLHIGFSNF
jgi:hypothetical protein